MRVDFAGEVVLVTGATRGIGRQIADDCARLGAELILTGTDPRRIAALNRAARRDQAAKRTWYAVDFSKRDNVDGFLAALGAYRRVDVCINNAAINRIEDVQSTRLEDYRDMLAVNLEAPYRLTRLLARMMKRQRYGRIVNIASIFGVISKPKRSLYSMTKFGLRGLTVATALELARYGVLVNAVSPGFVDTDLTRRNLGTRGMRELAMQVPLGRFAHPREIAKVVLFLASRENTYVTAQNIVVDGGFVNA